MQMTGRLKSQKSDTQAVQDVTDHIHQLLGNEEHLRRQENYGSFRAGEIKMLWNVRDGFSQGGDRIVDALETKCFLIAMGEIMEQRDRSNRVHLCIIQGQEGNSNVDLPPGRDLEHHGCFLPAGCRIFLDEEAHEPGLKCNGLLLLVTWLIVVKKLMVGCP